MKKIKGYSLVEVIVVVFIFVLLFSAVISFLITSDKSWRSGQNRLIEQREARRGMDAMARLIRFSNPNWGMVINSNKLLFYKLIFDSNSVIVDTHWVIFKIDPLNPSQLIKLEQGQNPVVLAQNVESINFSGGCPGCAAFNCLTLAGDCQVIAISLTTRKNTTFTLSSKVTLRNSAVVLPEEIETAAPAEGEF